MTNQIHLLRSWQILNFPHLHFSPSSFSSSFCWLLSNTSSSFSGNITPSNQWKLNFSTPLPSTCVWRVSNRLPLGCNLPPRANSVGPLFFCSRTAWQGDKELPSISKRTICSLLIRSTLENSCRVQTDIVYTKIWFAFPSCFLFA